MTHSGTEVDLGKARSLPLAVPQRVALFQHAGPLLEPDGLIGGMAAAVGVSEPLSVSNKGIDDFGTGVGTGGRGQASLCCRGHLGIRNTNVFGTECAVP
jgi:hypothetical protein